MSDSGSQVAGSDFLSDVKEEHIFWLAGGKSIRSLKELVNSLNTMDDGTFSYYVNKDKNDFANWVHDVIKDIDLSKNMREETSRQRTVSLIQDRMSLLEKPALIHVNTAEKKQTILKSQAKSIVGRLARNPARKEVKDNGRKNSETALATAGPGEAKKEQVQVAEQKKEEEPAPSPGIQASRISPEKIEEILQREKEIEIKEEKIREIEDRIESRLAAANKEPKFFSADFIQGLLIGLLIGFIGLLVYIRFWA